MAGAAYDIVVLSSSPPEPHHDAAPPALSPTSAQQQRVAMPATSSQSMSPLLSPQRPTDGALGSDSRAAPVPLPVSAGSGFATARSLLAEIDVNDRGLSAMANALESRRAPTGPEGTVKASRRPRKSTTKKAEGGEDAEKPKAKRVRKPKASNADGAASKATNAPATTSSYFANVPATENEPSARELASGPPDTKVTKARKPRAKKAAKGDGETQTTIKPAKITKPRAPRKSTKKAQGKAAEVVSSHFNARDTENGTTGSKESDATAEAPVSRNEEETIFDVPSSPSARSRGLPKQRPPGPDLTLDLDAAIGRRRDWTPPLETKRQEILTSSVGKENKAEMSTKKDGDFTSLVSGYSYEQPDTEPTSRLASADTAGAMKRRRVEVSHIQALYPNNRYRSLTTKQLVDLPGYQSGSRQSSPEKAKAPKKKARTITDLVTGQYAPEVLPESPEVTSDFFARRTTTVTKTSKVPLNDTTSAESSKALKKPARKRTTSKSASESGESKAKSKKASAKTAAKPKMVAEKLLSPTSAVMRMNKQDVLFGTSSQLALDESPTMVREIQKAIQESEYDADFRDSIGDADAPTVSAWPRLQKVAGRRSLWRASSRDDDGSVLEKQSVRLPEPDRTQDFPLLMDGTHEQSDDSFLDIDDIAPPSKVQAPVTISSDLPTPPPTIEEDNSAIAEDVEAKDSSFLDIDDFPPEPPPSGQNPDSSFFDIDDINPFVQAASEPPPQVTSVGPPIKRKGRAPKSQPAIPQHIPASAPALPSKERPTKSPRPAATSPSTPKKATSRFHAIEEILDSEDDEALSPTPPRTRKLKDVPPLAFDTDTTGPPAKDVVVSVHRIPESHLTFDAIRPTLFPAITSLIRSLPPSRDLSHPSWHEKMLMYDAIVVEDFTSFLNAQPVRHGIHTYKKATQKQIKAHNKAAREQGGDEVKVAEGSAEVLAVRKDVEAFMVQKWCEDMSVCCVSGEKKSSGARKGLY